SNFAIPSGAVDNKTLLGSTPQIIYTVSPASFCYRFFRPCPRCGDICQLSNLRPFLHITLKIVEDIVRNEVRSHPNQVYLPASDRKQPTYNLEGNATTSVRYLVCDRTGF